MNSSPIKIFLTSRQVAVQAGAHPQQVTRMTQRGVIKPAAATDSGLKLFNKSAVRIVIALRTELSREEYCKLPRADREAFCRRGGKLKP